MIHQGLHRLPPAIESSAATARPQGSGATREIVQVQTEAKTHPGSDEERPGVRGAAAPAGPSPRATVKGRDCRSRCLGPSGRQAVPTRPPSDRRRVRPRSRGWGVRRAARRCASRPLLIREMRLHTRLTAPIGWPVASRYPFTPARSDASNPSGRTSTSAEAPPDTSARTFAPAGGVDEVHGRAPPRGRIGRGPDARIRPPRSASTDRARRPHGKIGKTPGRSAL